MYVYVNAYDYVYVFVYVYLHVHFHVHVYVYVYVLQRHVHGRPSSTGRLLHHPSSAVCPAIDPRHSSNFGTSATTFSRSTANNNRLPQAFLRRTTRSSDTPSIVRAPTRVQFRRIVVSIYLAVRRCRQRRR